MRAFPPIAELPQFEGDAICQICLDPWGVRFIFESDSQVYAEYGIEHHDTDGSVWRYTCQADGGPPLALHRLLYKRIVSIDHEELRLTFKTEDGATLAILSDASPYEAGHVRTGDATIVF